MDWFHWIGVVVCTFIAMLIIVIGMLKAYFWLLHDRFHMILFRKGQRRLSLVSWHGSRLLGLGHNPEDTRHNADDWPINERPFYLSYRIGERRYFIMLGFMRGPRLSAVKGEHP